MICDNIILMLGNKASPCLPFYLVNVSVSIQISKAVLVAHLSPNVRMIMIIIVIPAEFDKYLKRNHQKGTR